MSSSQENVPVYKSVVAGSVNADIPNIPSNTTTAAAAAVAAAGVTATINVDGATNNNLTITNAAAAASAGGISDPNALIAFLHAEAVLLEGRAASLREYASKIATGRGTILEEELAPLDENGVPKYKGKKRGRKPKKRKRIRDPNAPKRKHTAYTLFVQETYPRLKQQYPQPGYRSKDIIAMVARQWKSMPDDIKKTWKERAILASNSVDDDDDEEEEDVDAEDNGDSVGVVDDVVNGLIVDNNEVGMV